ncbi:hypothetical protein EDD21DRAFT_440142 [Dissophora ornata]|nr:hypothetical protein BGZ58_000619 [Dissophora ornata]KAI8605664.1 hypothetical protein EDD21DRAFT_440142 [Dissophora ornata]
MCILLWTLPDSNHPRFKFAFASNRDEFMGRETSRAEFWDLDSILKRATRPEHPLGSQSISNVGILSGQDLQPSNAANYIIQETETTATGEEKVALALSTKDVPGTWLGITTSGDLVALTNYRETMEYMAQVRPPKLSRGKVCGEYLITMAAAHDSSESNVADGRAEQWIKRRAIGWEDEFEGLNLLVLQNTGDQQWVSGNREGSELSIFKKSPEANTSNSQTILPGSVVGVSNSTFSRPWKKVEVGVQALEKTLNNSIRLFGTGHHASLQIQSPSESSSSLPEISSPAAEGELSKDDKRELAWLVIEMLTLLRVNTKPFPKEDNADSVVMGLRERVFIPKVTMPETGHDYGTRSSSLVLFGRDNRLAVYVEKDWYGSLNESTRERPEYAADSIEGLVWWQGFVGQPRHDWRRVEGKELEALIQSAKEVQDAS